MKHASRIRNAAFLGALLASPTAAYACSCVRPADAAAAARAARAFFIGRVERIRPAPATQFGPQVTVTLSVERQWKGNVGRSVVVGSPEHTSACGFPFEAGRTYLVFAAQSDDGRLGVHLCSRSGLLSHSFRDAAALGEGRAVELDPAAPPPPPRLRPRS